MGASGRIPFGLVLGVHLALRVVANVPDLGKAANVELLGAELRHDGGGGGWAQYGLQERS